MAEFMLRLPNMITLLRVVLTIFLNLYIVNHFSSMLIPIIISFIIFLSDFLDGKIAKINGSASNVGAIFDVASDLFYIPLISYVYFQLSQNGYISFINALMYITTFLVFVSSSYRIRICIKKFKSLNNESLKNNYPIQN